MAIDFPNSPTVGQIFTSGNKSWIWDGVTWLAYGASLSPTVLKVDVTNSRVGINNQSPTTALDVTGTVKATQFSGGSAGFTNLNVASSVGNNAELVMNAPTSTNAVQYFQIAGVTKWQILSGGSSINFVEFGVATRLTIAPTTTTVSNNLYAAAGQGTVFAPIQNRLLSGSNNSAGIYMGGSGLIGNSATGGIEVSWGAANNNPQISLGVTRDTVGTKIVLEYTGGIYRFYSGNVEKLSITATAATFATSISSTSTVSGSQFNGGGSSYGAVASVSGTGIAYPGCTIGGGTANNMGMRWANPNITGTVDNAVTAVLGTVSDRRFKTNIETLTDALATIKQLRPVTYNPLDIIGFNDDNTVIVGDKDPYDTVEGFVADEVEQVAPWLVQGGENGGFQSVNYALFAPMLVSAIQELDQRLQQLETK